MKVDGPQGKVIALRKVKHYPASIDGWIQSI
jgi:hypothetical protein